MEKELPEDPVNNPSHYRHRGVECIDIAKTFDFCLGNVVKYIYRAGQKDPAKEVEDLEKAEYYLRTAINDRKLKQNNSNNKHMKLDLSKHQPSDLERAVSLDVATNFAKQIGMPDNKQVLSAIANSFLTGISYSATITPETELELRKQLAKTIEKINHYTEMAKPAETTTDTTDKNTKHTQA